MTNRDFYKEQILDIVCQGDGFAFNEYIDEITACDDENCNYCKFRNSGDCSKKLREWCNQEHIENPKLTENEKKFLDILNPNFRYMARDKDGTAYVYPASEKPTKDTAFNAWCGVKFHRIDSEMFNGMFSMIKWEDEEPWIIDDLRKLEVTE